MPLLDNDDFHPASQWEEPYTDHHMLTLYDLNRNPRPIKNPNRRLTVSCKNLNSEFICPVCLGYMRKASLVMECLHRFCGECIQKCLRLGKKECPSCRIHIPSRRSLRHDPEFDMLRQHILGDVRVLEEEEERQAQLAKSRNKLFSMTRKRGMVHQQAAMQQNKGNSKKSKITDLSIDESSESNSATTITTTTAAAAAFAVDKVEEKEKTKLVLEPETKLDHMEPTSLVQLLLLRHPQEKKLERLEKELLTISGKASMRVLKTFLSRKLSYNAQGKDGITILLKYQGSWVDLEDSMELGHVQTHLCNDSVLTLCYRIVS